MRLTINGEDREVSSSWSLEELVLSLGLPAQTVLLEHNGDALRRKEWPSRVLQEGDSLEIIRIVAGG